MNKPKLSFYTNMPTPYQVDFFSALTRHFSLEVVYFTKREADREWTLVDAEGYKASFLKNSWLARIVQKRIVSFHFSWSIITRAWKDNADFTVVNGTYWSPNVVLVLLLRAIRKRPVYFWGEPLFESAGSVKTGFKKRLLTLPLRRWSSAILAIGVMAERSYRQMGYKKEIFNIPYNIRNELFSPENIDKALYEELKRKWKGNGEIVLLSSGALVKRKGMDILIHAFKMLPQQLKARLIIIGDGPERKNLERLAGERPDIVFAGFQPKEAVPTFFRLADIFAFASRYDGWGLVINEALAAESAIVCSNKVGAAIDALENEVSAILCSTDNSEDWAKALERLISDEAFRRYLITNSRKCQDRLSSEYNAKKLYDIFTRA